MFKRVECVPLGCLLAGMGTFDLAVFVANPILAQVNRKSELYEIAAHYGVSVAVSLLKSELKSLEYLEAEGVLRASTVVEPPGPAAAASATAGLSAWGIGPSVASSPVG